MPDYDMAAASASRSNEKEISHRKVLWQTTAEAARPLEGNVPKKLQVGKSWFWQNGPSFSALARAHAMVGVGFISAVGVVPEETVQQTCEGLRIKRGLT